MFRVIALFAAMMQTPVEAQVVVASWYAQPGLMANGARYDPKKLTAAHKHLPFGTRLKLRYKDKKCSVLITDRGPFVRGRDLDLSKAAAKILGIDGIGNVEILATIPVKVRKKS